MPPLFKIEAEFTKYKIKLFEVYGSVAFSTFTMLCNNHHCLVLKHFFSFEVDYIF